MLEPNTSGFQHSIKVPRLYKAAAKIVKEVQENKGSLKTLVYNQKHNVKGLYALVVTTCKRDEQLDSMMKQSKILEKHTRMDPWLAKVLITELLWGKQMLKGDSKPVKTVLEYEEKLKAFLSESNQVNCRETKGDKPIKPRYARVNTLRISVSEAIDAFRDEGWTFVRFTDAKNYDGFLEKMTNLEPEEFMVDIHIKELLIFAPGTEFFEHRAYTDGLIFLVDKASCLPVELLNPSPGSVVLDMCAAPGMKTSQIACKLGNEGRVFALDFHPQRLKTVDELAEKYGIDCVTTVLANARKVPASDFPNVRFVLVDPSCSGSGIVDRVDYNASKKSTSTLAKRIAGLRRFQCQVLTRALKEFPDAERVVYSTCSLDPRENESVVHQVLSTCDEFRLSDGRELMPNWRNFGGEEFKDVGPRCLYARPEIDHTNGFFVAVFERTRKTNSFNPY